MNRVLMPAWKRLAALLLLAVTFAAGGAAAASHEESRACVPGEVIIGLTSGQPAESVLAAIRGLGGQEAGRNPALGVCRVKLPAGVALDTALERLRRVPGVAFATPNGRVTPAVTPDDPFYLQQQWSLRKVQADRAWESWRPLAPVVIAIVDSGIDHTHPDLSRMMLRDAQGLVGYDAWTNTRSDALDDHWHGTHCAGIAAAEANNGIGIAGVAGWNKSSGPGAEPLIRLMPIKVLNSAGYGDDWRVGNGIAWAADNGARVISLSLVTTVIDPTMSRAVGYAIGKGCVVVAAAGNDGVNRQNFPAAFPGVISVGATDDQDQLSAFSTYGSWVQTLAPGEAILSTVPSYPTLRNSRLLYRGASGTSMAAPHVAGAAALLLSQNPQLTPSQVAAILTTRVDPYTPYEGRMLAPGAGRLNVFNAVRAAGGGSGGGSTEGGGNSAPALALRSLTLEPGEVVGGESATAIVTLDVPPSVSGVLRLTTSSAAVVSVPAEVPVPAGATRVEFPVETARVSRITTVRITADSGGLRRAADLRILPPPPALASLVVAPGSLTGGRSTRATLRLTGPAPSGGARILLSADDPVLSLPASVTIPSGSTSVAFTITTRGVAARTDVTLSATYGSSGSTATVSLLPASLISLILRPSAVRAGMTTTGTVTLDAPAPSGGVRIQLFSADPAIAATPAEVWVPEGAATATFTVQTFSNSPAPGVVITAEHLGIQRSVGLRLFAPLHAAR